MATEDVIEVDPTKAAEYLRDEILALARRELNKPWEKMHAGEQENIASRVETMCKATVWHVVQAISGAGREVVKATMGPLAVDKSGNFTSKITFGALESEDKIAVIDRIGRGIHVVLMDETQYQTYRTKVEIQADQPGLPLDNEPQPEWPVVAAAIKDEGPEVIDLSDPVARAAAGLSPAAEEMEDDEVQPVAYDTPEAALAAAEADFEEDERGPIPAHLQRAQVTEAPDAGELVDDEEAAVAPAADLVDDEPMAVADVAKTVDIPNPVNTPAPNKPTAPKPRARPAVRA